MNKKFIEIYEQSENSSHHNWHGHRIFAVDGSKLNLPRSLSEEGYKTPASGNYPQGLVSTLYHLKAKIPYDYDLAKHGNERLIAIQHLNPLSQNDVVVYDRGYFSYPMLYRHIEKGVFAVFRLPKSGFHQIRAFIEGDEADVIIDLEPKRSRTRNKLAKQLGVDSVKPLRLRLLKYQHDNTTYYLGTTLLDQTQYPSEIFSDIYHARWGIEELYKTSKQLIGIEDFHSKSERGVKQELFAHFVLITLTRMFANQAEDSLNSLPKNQFSLFKIQGNPLEQREMGLTRSQKIRVNFKNSITVVSRHLEAIIFGGAAQLTETIQQVIQAISHVKYQFRGNRKFIRISLKPISKWRGKIKLKRPLMTPPLVLSRVT